MITTKDGNVISVGNSEKFLANPAVLIILDEQQMLHHFAWRNIVELKTLDVTCTEIETTKNGLDKIPRNLCRIVEGV